MGKTLYLLRHGVAESGHGKADEDRALTPEGVQGILLVARALGRMGGRVERIVSSPLLRTRQTADTIRNELPVTEPVVESDVLRPGADAVQVVAECQAHSDVSTLLLVGHLPDLSGVLGYLVSGHPTGAFGFQPGSIARIDFQGAVRPSFGVVRWLLAPEQLQALVKL